MPSVGAAVRTVLDQHAEATCNGYCAGCGHLCGAAVAGAVPVRDVMRHLMYYHNYAELDARDRGVANAYTMQAATQIASTATDLPTYEAAVRLLANRSSGPQIGERKANQRCWTCEDRHTCTFEPLGWACDVCREIS